MNWVGGVRNRLKVKSERKRQQDFFEKQKFASKVKRLETSGSPSTRRQAVSQDLVSLQAASFSAACFKKNDSNKGSHGRVHRVDLDKSRGLFGQKFVDLPDDSPESKPSALTLSRPSPHASCNNPPGSSTNIVSTISEHQSQSGNYDDSVCKVPSKVPKYLRDPSRHRTSTPIDPWHGFRRSSRQDVFFHPMRPGYPESSSREMDHVKKESLQLTHSSEKILLRGASERSARTTEEQLWTGSSRITPGSGTSGFSSTVSPISLKTDVGEAAVSSLESDDWNSAYDESHLVSSPLPTQTVSQAVHCHHAPPAPHKAPTEGEQTSSTPDSSLSSFTYLHRVHHPAQPRENSKERGDVQTGNVHVVNLYCVKDRTHRQYPVQPREFCQAGILADARTDAEQSIEQLKVSPENSREPTDQAQSPNLPRKSGYPQHPAVIQHQFGAGKPFHVKESVQPADKFIVTDPVQHRGQHYSRDQTQKIAHTRSVSQKQEVLYNQDSIKANDQAQLTPINKMTGREVVPEQAQLRHSSRIHGGHASEQALCRKSAQFKDLSQTAGKVCAVDESQPIYHLGTKYHSATDPGVGLPTSDHPWQQYSESRKQMDLTCHESFRFTSPEDSIDGQFLMTERAKYLQVYDRHRPAVTTENPVDRKQKQISRQQCHGRYSPQHCMVGAGVEEDGADRRMIRNRDQSSEDIGSQPNMTTAPFVMEARRRLRQGKRDPAGAKCGGIAGQTLSAHAVSTDFAHECRSEHTNQQTDTMNLYRSQVGKSPGSIHHKANAALQYPTRCTQLSSSAAYRDAEEKKGESDKRNITGVYLQDDTASSSDDAELESSANSDWMSLEDSADSEEESVEIVACCGENWLGFVQGPVVMSKEQMETTTIAQPEEQRSGMDAQMLTEGASSTAQQMLEEVLALDRELQKDHLVDNGEMEQMSHLIPGTTKKRTVENMSCKDTTSQTKGTATELKDPQPKGETTQLYPQLDNCNRRAVIVNTKHIKLLMENTKSKPEGCVSIAQKEAGWEGILPNCDVKDNIKVSEASQIRQDINNSGITSDTCCKITSTESSTHTVSVEPPSASGKNSNEEKTVACQARILMTCGSQTDFPTQTDDVVMATEAMLSPAVPTSTSIEGCPSTEGQGVKSLCDGSVQCMLIGELLPLCNRRLDHKDKTVDEQSSSHGETMPSTEAVANDDECQSVVELTSQDDVFDSCQSTSQ